MARNYLLKITGLLLVTFPLLYSRMNGVTSHFYWDMYNMFASRTQLTELKHFLVISNMLDFCILPRATEGSSFFMDLLFHNLDVDTVILEEISSEEFFDEKVYYPKEDGQYKIPLKVHR